MLDFFGRSHRYCDGISRRDFLRVGTLGLGGLTLANLLQLQARGEAASAKEKSVIMIFLSGGPSHIDTYDMKPDLPDDFRGEFKPIQTNVPGVQICELMPLQAKIADKLAILRGVKTVGNHTGNEFFSGFAFEEGKPISPINSHRPALGSIVSRLRGSVHSMPPYVSLHDNPSWEHPYYVGAAHRPFRVFKNQKQNEALDDLKLRPGMSVDQLHDRRSLLQSFDTLRRDIDASGTLAGLDAINTQALDIITSSKVRDAFDVSKEPEKLKSRYGVTPAAFGFQPGLEFLQARRLVEAGTRVVSLAVHGWDTHQDNFKALRHQVPIIDQALYALLTDLEERGLDKDVTIIMGGEMGRTPRISKDRAGREHWPETGISILAGGGLQTGQVVGASDAKGEQVKGRAITPQMMLATVYHALGINPVTTVNDHANRPMYLLDEREKIEALV